MNEEGLSAWPPEWDEILGSKGPLSLRERKRPKLAPAPGTSVKTANIGDLKITSASTERQKRSQNLAPVLVIISGNYRHLSSQRRVRGIVNLAGVVKTHYGGVLHYFSIVVVFLVEGSFGKSTTYRFSLCHFFGELFSRGRKRPKLATPPGTSVHAQCDWTTGVLDNGNEWRKFRAVPRSYPLRPLVLYFV